MIAKQLCASTELSDEAPWWCDSQAGIVGVGARTCRTLFRTRYGGDKMARSATRRGDAWLAIDQYHVRKLHARNITGSRVKIGIFDSGIGRALDTAEVRRAQYAVNVTKIRTTWHPHTNRTLKTCHDFTGKDKGCKGKARCSCSDTLGHGNLAAGIVTGESDMCPGLAPNAELHMFKVFDRRSFCPTSSTIRGMIPDVADSERSPIIVHVLPLPVWPYASTVALYPSKHSATRFRAVDCSYTSRCVDAGEKTRSNANVFDDVSEVYRTMDACSSSNSAHNLSLLEELRSNEFSGRKRATTEMPCTAAGSFPGMTLALSLNN
jgi:hypothetical protein